jgi:hypothetical protein
MSQVSMKPGLFFIGCWACVSVQVGFNAPAFPVDPFAGLF